MANTTPTGVTNTKVTFGVPSLLKETPAIARAVASAVLYIAAIGNIVLVSFPQIPHELKGTIAQYSLSTVAAVKAVLSLFGIEVTAPTYTTKQ